MSGRLTSENDPTTNHCRCNVPPASSTHSTSSPATTMVEHPDLSVGFIGAGNMATAMAKGFLTARLLSPDRVIASSRTEASLSKFRDAVDEKVVVTKNNEVVAAKADILFLCVKPQFLMDVLNEIKSSIRSKEVVVVSVVAGISIAQISGVIGDVKIIRVMPNTPCLVSQGAAALCCNPQVTADEERIVVNFFSNIGKCVKVPQEHLIDAVSGLSGSGPAYVLTMIEAMADGGVKMGLPRAVAVELAAQTVKGAACLVLETGKHPAQLRDEIMSPAGTTAFGIHALEGGRGFRNSVINAIEAATTRAQQLKALGEK